MTHADRIKTMLTVTEPKSFQANNWGRYHVLAWRGVVAKNGAARAIAKVAEGLAEYADAYRREYESKLGDDGVLGEPWADGVRGLRALLNGQTDGLDCGTVDGLLCAMLKAEGFDV